VVTGNSRDATRATRLGTEEGGEMSTSREPYVDDQGGASAVQHLARIIHQACFVQSQAFESKHLSEVRCAQGAETPFSPNLPSNQELEVLAQLLMNNPG
jgi:hypothetical protein